MTAQPGPLREKKGFVPNFKRPKWGLKVTIQFWYRDESWKGMKQEQLCHLSVVNFPQKIFLVRSYIHLHPLLFTHFLRNLSKTLQCTHILEPLTYKIKPYNGLFPASLILATKLEPMWHSLCVGISAEGKAYPAKSVTATAPKHWARRRAKCSKQVLLLKGCSVGTLGSCHQRKDPILGP